MKFAKPALTIEEQVSLLTNRGLLIDDPRAAQHYLAHSNYYRLAAYFIPYQAGIGIHDFVSGSRFERVVADYEFDRSFKLLLLDAIERIEVSVRTQWAYFISHQFGPHGYTVWNKRIYKSEHLLKRNLKELGAQVGRSQEPFIEHLVEKYDELLPPAWASCEVMSLGLLSKMYGSLSSHSVRKQISVLTPV